MIQSIINALIPVIVTAVTGILVAIVKTVGDSVIELIQAKIKAVALKMGVDQYNADLVVAKNIFNIVDEYFRITPTATKTIEAAQAKFTEEILKAIPSITPQEIEQLRQAVAGEVNKGKDVIVAPVVEEVKPIA